MEKKRNGFLFVLIAALLFSMGGVCSKFTAWNGFTINGFRCFLGFIVIGIYLFITKHRIIFNKKIALGAVFLFLTTTLCMLANKLTTAANAIILQYAAPVYIILYVWLFKRQRPGWIDICTCVLVFAGLICFFIDGLSMGGMLGNVIALLSGAAFAGFCITGSDESTDNMSMIFFGFLLSAVVGMPFIALETDFSALTLSMAALMGVFQIGLAYIFFGIGLKSSGPVTTSLISGLEPILNPIWVALLYGERMGVMALAGAAIVILSILSYNVVTARKKSMRNG